MSGEPAVSAAAAGPVAVACAGAEPRPGCVHRGSSSGTGLFSVSECESERKAGGHSVLLLALPAPTPRLSS